MDELKRVVIAAPCPLEWEQMAGNDRVRFCNSCSKNVYNISDMTAKEAQAFLEENGTSQCVRLYRRADGTLMTDNCPVGLRALRNRARMVYKIVASAAASFMAFMPGVKNGAHAQQAEPGQVKNEEPIVVDGRPLLKKNTVNIPATPGTSTPAPRMMGGAIALPPTNTGNNKKIMMGGECGTEKKNDVNKGGKFTMGEMTVAPKNNGGNFKRDGKALDLYEQAQANERTGNFILAKTQYQEALDSARKQQPSDPKFAETLQECVNRMSKKITTH